MVLEAEINSRNIEALRTSPDKTNTLIYLLSPAPFLLLASFTGCRLFRLSVAVLGPTFLIPILLLLFLVEH